MILGCFDRAYNYASAVQIFDLRTVPNKDFHALKSTSIAGPHKRYSTRTPFKFEIRAYCEKKIYIP